MPSPSDGRYQIYPNRNPDEAIAVRCQFDGDGAWTVRYMIKKSICYFEHSLKYVLNAVTLV